MKLGFFKEDKNSSKKNEKKNLSKKLQEAIIPKSFFKSQSSRSPKREIDSSKSRRKNESSGCSKQKLRRNIKFKRKKHEKFKRETFCKRTKRFGKSFSHSPRIKKT